MALADRGAFSIKMGRRDLEQRGLAVTLRLTTTMAGPYAAYTLTDAGRQAARRLSDPPGLPRTNLDTIDRTLATVDLALHLRQQGEGDWRTWPEYLRGHPAVIPRDLGLHSSPSGVLCAPDNTCTPIWVIFHARYPGPLRQDVAALYGRRELEPARIYALPPLLPWLQGLRLISDDIRPWNPPHLRSRAPLQPGWAHPFAGNGARLPEPGADTPRLRPLGPRQLAILAWLDRFSHATVDQIARAAGIAPHNAAAVLRVLEQQARAQRHRGVHKGCRRGQRQADVWSTTAAGLAAAASPRKAMRPQPLHRSHTLALVDLAHKMEADTGGRWEGERELGPETMTEFGRDSRRDGVAPPDGRLTLPDGRRLLIQLQLSIGNAPYQCIQARRQCLFGLGDEVWFVCTPEVAPRYRREVKPWEAPLIKVLEWTPPDRSGGLREPNPAVAAHKQAAAARAAARKSGAAARLAAAWRDQGREASLEPPQRGGFQCGRHDR